MLLLRKTSAPTKSILSSTPLRFLSYTPKAFVGTPAPEFKKTALMPNGSFGQVSLSQYKGKYVVLFFYPLDFTFVCPTEIIAFSERAKEFKNINCEVLAASTDSEFSHLAWTNQDRKKGGLGKMEIPIISDVNKSLSKDYGVLIDDAQIALRGLFIIDDKGILRQSTINDLPVGRNVDEALRLVKAFQFTDKHGEVCPAGWTEKNSKTINTKKAEEYFASVN